MPHLLNPKPTGLPVPLGAQGYLLDGREGASVPYTPMEFKQIVVLLVVVQDSSGQYLVLKTLLYEDERPDGRGFGGGCLVLPYREFLMDPSDPQLKTVGAVREYLVEQSKWNDRKDVEGAARKAAWDLGLPDSKVRPLNELYVLKPKIRATGGWQAIRFHSCIAWNEVEAGRMNLADPEGLGGLVHLPLDDLDSVIARRWRGADEEWWQFRGRPIAFEVQQLLAPERRERLTERPVRLRAEDFSRPDEGLIVVADFARWGSALQAASQPKNAIGVDATTNVERLVDYTNVEVHRFLHQVDPTYVLPLGDGFLATFPEHAHDQKEVLSRLLREWPKLLRNMERINQDLRDAGIVIGSRLALHHDSYFYGKTAQALSSSVAVKGPGIVKAFRLEHALSNWVDEQGGSARADTLRHSLAVSEEAMACHGEALASLHEHLVSYGTQILKAKEFEGSASIFLLAV